MQRLRPVGNNFVWSGLFLSALVLSVNSERQTRDQECCTQPAAVHGNLPFYFAKCHLISVGRHCHDFFERN